MKRYIVYILAGVFVALFVGCEEHVVMKYEDENGLYFENWAFGQHDSIVYSFFVKEDDRTRDTIWVDVRTSGFISMQDRPVVMEQVNTGDSLAMVAGKHYIAFNDPVIQDLMVVKSGADRFMLPVIVLRDDPILKSKTLRLVIRVGENEFFKKGIIAQQDFIIRLSDYMDKPTEWDARWKWRSTFGEWHSLKGWFMLRYGGLSDFDEWPPGGGDSAFLTYLQNLMYMQLKKYNEGPDGPLCPDHQGPKNEQCPNCITFPKP